MKRDCQYVDEIDAEINEYRESLWQKKQLFDFIEHEKVVDLQKAKDLWDIDR